MSRYQYVRDPRSYLRSNWNLGREIESVTAAAGRRNDGRVRFEIAGRN